MAKKDGFRSTTMGALVRTVEQKPNYYPQYKFKGRVFKTRDVPGKKPTQQS